MAENFADMRRLDALVRAGWVPTDNERHAVLVDELEGDGSLFEETERQILGVNEAHARCLARATPKLQMQGYFDRPRAVEGYAPTFRTINGMPRCRTPLLNVPVRPSAPGVACMEVLPDTVLMYLLEIAGLNSTRAVACSSGTLRHEICLLMCRKTSVTISPEDVCFCNAAYCSRLPTLERIHVMGDSQFPVLDIARLRAVPRIKIQRMQSSTALFLGAALAGGDHTVRLSSIGRPESHLYIMSLSSAASRETLELSHIKDLAHPDVALLLGSLSINDCLKSIKFKAQTNNFFGDCSARLLEAADTAAQAQSTFEAVLTAAGLSIPEQVAEKDQQAVEKEMPDPYRCFVTGSRHIADRCFECGGCEVAEPEDYDPWDEGW